MEKYCSRCKHMTLHYSIGKTGYWFCATCAKIHADPKLETRLKGK